MMELSNVQILLIVNFIHTTCIGMILPYLSPHIVAIGGNHIITGFMMAGANACQLLAKDFVELFEHGKKFMLTFCLFSFFLAYLLLATTSSILAILLCRLGATLVNRVEHCSKDMVKIIEPESNHIKIFNLIDIINTAGISAGAIAGGYVFDCSDDFESNAILAAIFTLIGVLLIQYIDQDPPGDKASNKIIDLPQNCLDQLLNLTQVNYRDHWDVFMLKSAYIASFVIFFSRYVMLIRYNYQAGTIIIGYTVAYQNMLVFAASCVTPFLKRCLEAIFLPKEVFEHALVLVAGVLVAIYNAPTYECYLFVFIPLVMSYTLVNNFFEEDVLDLRATSGVYDAISTIKILINIGAPILFGVIYHFVGTRAFKMVCFLPPLVCAYVINQRFITEERRSFEELRSRPEEEHEHNE